jgi:hypothetical protein
MSKLVIFIIFIILCCGCGLGFKDRIRDIIAPKKNKNKK